MRSSFNYDMAQVQQELAELRQSVSTLAEAIRFQNNDVNNRQTGTYDHDAPALPVSASLPPDLAPPVPHILPAPVARPQALLPALPQRLILAIQRYQFVSFDAIFAATAHAVHARAADRSSLFSLAISTDDLGGPAIDVLPRALTARERITNYHSWALAFNLFLRCATHFRSFLALPLIRYQGIINGFANAYLPSAWLAYDIAFRHHVANNPQIPWDQVDEEIFTVHLRSSQSVVRCFTCHATGHMSSTCPRSSTATSHRPASSGVNSQAFSSVSSSSFPPNRAGSRGSATAPRSATLAPGPSRVSSCFAWNSPGGCNRPFCRYRHLCSRCGGSHKFTYCPSSGP